MKILRFILLICLLVWINAGYAQSFKITSFEQSVNDLYARTRERLDSLGTPCAAIRISTTNPEDFHFEGIVGEPVYSQGEVVVYLSQGTDNLKLTTGNKKAKTYRFDAVEKQCVYIMNIKRESFAAQRTRVLIIPSVWCAFSNYDMWGGGIMVGVVKKIGAYFKYNMDIFGSYDHLSSVDYVCDKNGMTSTNEQVLLYDYSTPKLSNYSVTAGGIIRLKPMAYLYAGTGYVSDRVGLITQDNKVAEITDYTLKGLAAEAGLIFRFGKIGITLGYESNQFKNHKVSAGLGVIF